MYHKQNKVNPRHTLILVIFRDNQSDDRANNDMCKTFVYSVEPEHRNARQNNGIYMLDIWIIG
jgi:hypothetical protein